MIAMIGAFIGGWLYRTRNSRKRKRAHRRRAKHEVVREPL
jgi:hypothetical protein